MSIEKIIPVDKELVNIFGVNDQNLKYLKDRFKKIKINVRGNVVYISGDNGQTTDIMKILDEMLSMAERGEIIEIEDQVMVQTMQQMRDRLNLFVEPACAASLGAALGPLRSELCGKRVGVLACGSNISADRYLHFIT